MDEYIGCRSCDSKSCTGCNMLTLEWMLDHGKFDCLMDEHHTITPADVVEVKRGRWEHEGGDWSDIWMCTACGEPWFFEYNPTAFCPNCGADMREVDDAN